MKIIDLLRTCSNVDFNDTLFTVSTIEKDGPKFKQYKFSNCPTNVLTLKVICFSFLNKEEQELFNGSEILISAI